MGCTTSTDAGDVRRIPGNAPEKAANQDENTTVQLDEEAMAEFAEQRLDKEGNVVGKYDRSEKRPEDPNALFEVEEAGAGDEFMAVKPWLGAIVKPTNPPPFNPNPPEKKLELEYVYGYRCIDSRMNLFYSYEGKAVYMTAALGVVLDINTNTQKFFGGGSSKNQVGHNDDITALAVCPKRELVATGQCGKNPIICIWRADTCEKVAQFTQGRDTRAVKAIAFNKDGTMIATVGADNDHSVFAFKIDGTKLGQEKGGPDPILDVSWHPTSNQFATAGQRGAAFYSLESGRLTGNKGLFGSNKMAALCCAVYGPDGKLYTGSADGRILIWEGRNCTKSFQVATGAINAVCPTQDKILVGGGKSLLIYDTSLKKTGEIALQSSARAIDIKGNDILLGLRDGTIVEYTNGTQPRVLMQSHSDGEAWGLDIDPTTGYILTTADDNKIMIWDPETRKCVQTAIVNQKAGPKQKIGGASTLSTFPPNQCSRAVCINPKNGHVAIGTNNGEVHVHSDIKSLKLIKAFQPAKEWIECMAYSPDGTKLAVGSHDNNIYIFDAQNYNLVAKCTRHKSFVTSLDWSTDSRYIQSVCGAYEYIFHDASTGSQLTGGASQLKDEPWATFTCKLGWPVQGVFPSGTDGSHINGVDRSKAKDLIATGDDWGLVNIYRNPCLTGAKPNSYKGHSEHVVRVRFDKSDTRLYSIGGYDRTLMQWRVTK